MGYMKNLLITIHNGGEEAVRAVQEYLDLRQSMVEQVSDTFAGVQKWISVSDRMPEDGKVVLAWNRNRAVFGYARDGQWIDTLYGWVVPNGPTHWMPLPEPPEVTQ